MWEDAVITDSNAHNRTAHHVPHHTSSSKSVSPSIASHRPEPPSLPLPPYCTLSTSAAAAAATTTAATATTAIHLTTSTPTIAAINAITIAFTAASTLASRHDPSTHCTAHNTTMLQ